MFAIVVKGLRNYGLLILICIPLFFINIKSWSDWGDDFAQYIHQSVNLGNGIPQTETGYIFNKNFPLYSPPAYPPGFPILLLPVLKIYGASIHALTIYMTFYLSLFALLLFKFLSRYFSSLVSFMLIIISIYNPWTLSFKADIVSDIPFAAGVLLSLNLFYSVSRKDIIGNFFLCLVISFCLLTRTAGIALPLSLIIHGLMSLRHASDRESKKRAWTLFLIAGISMVIYIILNKLMFPGAFNYKFPWNFYDMYDTIRHHLTYNTGVLRAFFETWNDKWHFISIITGSMIFTFIILGFIRKIATNISFADIFFIVYIAIILVYPYSNAGFRFLLPALPVLLIYLVKGINSVDLGLRLNRTALTIGLTVLTLFTYKKGVAEIIKSSKHVQEGPQLPENREMFDFIVKNIPADARFSFTRPRALALYTSRSAMAHNPDAPATEIQNDLSENNIDYILINSEDYNQNIVDYVYSKGLKLIWENSHNKIYSLK